MPAVRRAAAGLGFAGGALWFPQRIAASVTQRFAPVLRALCRRWFCGHARAACRVSGPLPTLWLRSPAGSTMRAIACTWTTGRARSACIFIFRSRRVRRAASAWSADSNTRSQRLFRVFSLGRQVDPEPLFLYDAPK